MSRADVEAGARAALEAAAKLQDEEARLLAIAMSYVTSSSATQNTLGRQRNDCVGRAQAIRALDPAAIAAGVPETELCGSRGFAGPSGCIRQKGHAGEHKYGTIDFPINPVMVDQLVRQQEEIERLRARVAELEKQCPPS